MPKSKTVLSIQYLRAIAALMVVAHHSLIQAPWFFNPLYGWEFGSSGVDIFFVISGFVMFYVAREEGVGEFLYKRAIRIVPLYWLATLGFVMLLWIGMFDGLPEQWLPQTFNSLFFVPQWHPQYPEHLWPILIPGWSLNYEVFFYAIFAVGLGTRKLLPVVCGAIVILVAVGFLFGPFENPVLAMYTNIALLEFLSGIAIAAVVGHTWVSKTYPLLGGGFALLAVAGLDAKGLPGEAGRILGASCVVLGAVALELRGWLPTWKRLELLGAASYSIYLSHVITIVVAIKVWEKLPIGGWAQLLGLIASALLVAAVFGSLIHKYVELPMLRFLKGIGPTTKRQFTQV